MVWVLVPGYWWDDIVVSERPFLAPSHYISRVIFTGEPSTLLQYGLYFKVVSIVRIGCKARYDCIYNGGTVEPALRDHCYERPHLL